MNFVNARKNFSRSFLTFVIILLSIVSVTFAAVGSSANSAAGEKTPPEKFSLADSQSGKFDFLANNIAAFFNGAGRTSFGSESNRAETIADSPVFARFDAWLKERASGNVTDKSANDELGERLAIERRQALKELIRQNPQAALGKAISAENYQDLPSFITEHLEKPISANGDFLVYVLDGDHSAGKKSGKIFNDRTERSVVVGESRYQAFVYGRREAMTTKLDIPLQGIAIDDVMAVDESPVRKIGSAEYRKRAADAPESSEDGAAAEVGGTVLYFSDDSELDSFVDEQIAWESKIGPVRPKANSVNETFAPEEATRAWTEGTKTVLVIRVDFSDRPGEPVDPNGQPLTVTRLQNLFANEVSPFYVNNSYNKTAMQATITPTVVRLPNTQAYYVQNYAQMWDDARNAARAANPQNPLYETDNYDLDVIAFSYTSGIGWAGVGYVGGKGTLINGSFDVRVASHELGHNYGLNHANLWRTNDGTSIGSGSDVEYGDNFDMMGYGGDAKYHFNASYKRSLDWLTDANVQTVTTGGDYQIYAQDANTAGGIRALKIRKDAVENYWIEFRQLFTNNSNVMNGALIRWQYISGGIPKTQLLDMNPSTSTSSDAPLLVGQSFYDSASQIRITILGKGNTSPESLNVRIELNQTSGATPTPTPTGCTYSISPASQSFGSAGGTGSVTVTTQSGCSWSAAGNQSFVGISSGTSGNGSGTVNYTVAANTGSARSAAITVAGQTFTVQQAGAAVGTYTVTVTPGVAAPNGQLTVSWTAPSGSTYYYDWIGLYRVGTTNDQHLGHIFTGGATFGSFTVALPDTGQYEFRYLVNQSLTSVATSNTVTIQSTTPTPTPTPSSTMKGDVNPRPSQAGNLTPGKSGDGAVTAGDITQVSRFALGLDTPDAAPNTSNEFQKADCAPLGTSGDGLIAAGDVTQARRFALGLDQPQFAQILFMEEGNSLPFELPMNKGLTEAKDNSELEQAAAAISVTPVVVSRVGQTLTVGVVLNTDPSGPLANAISFTLNFNPADLSNPTNIRRGSGAVGTNGNNASLGSNQNAASMGRLGLLLSFDPPETFQSGTRQIVLIDFTVAGGAATTTTLGFSDGQALNPQTPDRFISDIFGNRLDTRSPETFGSNTVSTAGPTAARAAIGGRVRNAGGAGIGGVEVTLVEAATGRSTQTRTDADGAYRFAELEVGNDYIVTARLAGYGIAPASKQFSLVEELTEADFVATKKRAAKGFR